MTELRKRKKGNTPSTPDTNAKTPKSPTKQKKKGLTLSQLFLFLGTVVSIVSAIVYFYYSRYGPTLLFGKAHNDWSWSAQKWRSYLLAEDGTPTDTPKTILLLGGPHRGGTTIVWEAIASHPLIAGFGSTFDTGVDYSEGVLMQDVYPRFGVGLEKFQGNTGGLGEYALLEPESKAHWTEENQQEQVTGESFRRLMNRFAPHWCSGGGGREKTEAACLEYLRDKKVLVEKSPQNAVLTRFLHAVYNIDETLNGSTEISELPESKNPSLTKFVFITRHPLANILATDKFRVKSMGAPPVSYERLLQNYIQMHKYMLEDAQKVSSEVIWVKLEDFAWNPKETIVRLFERVGLGQDADDITEKILREWTQKEKNIRKDPNSKYAKEWCQKGGEFEKHQDLVLKYDEEIINLNLGYDLRSWCFTEFNSK